MLEIESVGREKDLGEPPRRYLPNVIKFGGS